MESAFDYNVILQALVSPYLWWLYLVMAEFLFLVSRFIRRLGKDKHLIGELRGGLFHILGTYYVSPLQDVFRTRSRRTFTTDSTKASFTEGALGGDRQVVFHLFRKAKPRESEARLYEVKHETVQGPDGKEVDRVVYGDEQVLKVVVKPKLAKGEEDPTSKDFDDFVSREGMRQANESSSGGWNANKIMIFMALGVGIAIGAFAVVVALPHGIYPIYYPITNATGIAGSVPHG